MKNLMLVFFITLFSSSLAMACEDDTPCVSRTSSSTTPEVTTPIDLYEAARPSFSDQNFSISNGDVIGENGEKIGEISSSGEVLTNADIAAKAEIAASGDQCNANHNYAASLCKIQNFTPIIMALVPGLVSGGEKDLNKACKEAANTSKMTGAVSAAISVGCGQAAKACLASCGTAKTNGVEPANSGGEDAMGVDAMLSECKGFGMNEMMLAMSAMQAIQGAAQARGCESSTADTPLWQTCNTEPERGNAEKCADYYACNTTEYPANAGHPKCEGKNNIAGPPAVCNSPSASVNPQCGICYQPQYASHPNCQGFLAQNGGAGGTNGDNNYQGGVDGGTGLGIDGLDDPFQDDEFSGFDGNVADSGALASKAGGGGGGGLGGGGGGAGGAPSSGGAAGPGSSPYDTDIIGKASGGSSGGGSSFAGGYAGSGSAWKKAGRAAGTGKSKSQFDFSKFLPKKGKAKSRKTASVTSLSSMGISKANGLTNFQKVSRMLNKKKPELIKKP